MLFLTARLQSLWTVLWALGWDVLGSHARSSTKCWDGPRQGKSNGRHTLFLSSYVVEAMIPLHQISVSSLPPNEKDSNFPISLPTRWHTPILHQRWLCSKWLPHPSHCTRKSKNYQGTHGCLLPICHNWPIDILLLPVLEKKLVIRRCAHPGIRIPLLQPSLLTIQKDQKRPKGTWKG